MSQITIVENLKRIPFFSSLNQDDLIELSRVAIEKTILPGEFLYLENDLPQYFYFLSEGRIKAFTTSSLGKEFILGFLGSGEILGPVSILRGKPSVGSMQAVTHTKIFGFKKDVFTSFIFSHPQISLEITKILSARIDEFCRRLRDLAGERVEQRIARILLMLSSRLGSNLPFTRHEVAEMVGTTTESAIRIMRHLKSMGIIDSLRGKIVIVDAAKLRLLIEQEK